MKYWTSERTLSQNLTAMRFCVGSGSGGGGLVIRLLREPFVDDAMMSSLELAVSNPVAVEVVQLGFVLPPIHASWRPRSPRRSSAHRLRRRLARRRRLLASEVVAAATVATGVAAAAAAAAGAAAAAASARVHRKAAFAVHWYWRR